MTWGWGGTERVCVVGMCERDYGGGGGGGRQRACVQ